MKNNYLLMRTLLFLIVGMITSSLFGNEASYTKDINISEFSNFIKKAEADKAIIDYFNSTEIENVKLTSRDKISLNEFLETTQSVFGKNLINDESQFTNYILVDFNIMFSAYFIEVILKEVDNGKIVNENIISVKY